MPMISYACDCGRMQKRLYRSAKEIATSIFCKECGKEMRRQLSSSTQSSKISVDNGVQARRVEISPDIIETNQERSKKNYREE